MQNLAGKNVLIAVSNRGVEQDELKVPAERLAEAGATVTIAAPEVTDVKTLVGDWDLGEIWPVGQSLESTDIDEFDLLVLPGGTLNADQLRLDPEAQRITRDFASAGKPVASICHGPWLLVETGLVKGKTLTSYQSISTDVINAGGMWKDQEVFRCPANGWVLITSRNPGDLTPFVDSIAAELAGDETKQD